MQKNSPKEDALIAIQTEISMPALVEFSKFHFRKHLHAAKILSVAGLFLLPTAFLDIFIGDWLLPLFLMSAVHFWLWHFYIWSTKRSVSKGLFDKALNTYYFTEKELLVDMVSEHCTSSVTIPWDKVYAIHQTPDRVYFYVSKVSAFIVPVPFPSDRNAQMDPLLRKNVADSKLYLLSGISWKNRIKLMMPVTFDLLILVVIILIFSR